MGKKVARLYGKHRELILYLFFGGATTVVNYGAYLALARGLGCSTGGATAWAWAASVAFAYLTNRVWVFESRARGSAALKEAGAFVAARLFSGIMDWAVMVAAVDYMGWDDRLVKLGSNVVVIILNYLLSKFLIFRKKNR